MTENPKEIVRRAKRVAEIVEDADFLFAVKELSTHYVREWRAAKSVDEREAVHAKATALEDLVQKLKTVIQDGQVTAHQIEASKRDA